MSLSTVCPGCGQRVQAPAGHKRRKLQCPACGVMCELPEQTEEHVTAKPRREPVSVRSIPPPEDEAPAQPPPVAIGTARAGETIHVCRICSERIRIAGGADGKLSHCPVCGTAVTLVVAETPLRPKKKSPKPPPPRRTVETPPQ